MKRNIFLLILTATLFFLSGCSHEAKLLGRWEGDGTLDFPETEVPMEFASALHFYEDGSLRIEHGSTFEIFSFSATDDTLTISDGEVGWGIPYTRKGNTLHFRTASEDSIFIRVG